MNNMKNLEKIAKSLEKLNLSKKETDDLTNFFSKTEDKDLELMANAFENNASLMEKICDNIKQKRMAIKNKDIKEWEEIITDEIIDLARIEAGE